MTSSMETFYALQAFCKGNHSLSFDIFFDLRLNKRLSKQWRHQCFALIMTSLKWIWRFWHTVAWFRDLARSYNRTSHRVVNAGMILVQLLHRKGHIRCAWVNLFMNNWFGYHKTNYLIMPCQAIKTNHIILSPVILIPTRLASGPGYG